MTAPDDQPAVTGRRRVRPYAMTGGRTRPSHEGLEIEALVATTSIGEQTPKLTVEQRAIAALCHDLLSIAGVIQPPHAVGLLIVAWLWSVAPRWPVGGASAVRASARRRGRPDRR
jgi:hypothetical protein